MQQLFAAFGIDWRLILAQAINFGIVLFALRYFLYTPVMNSIENRRKVVAKGVEDAQQAEVMLASADETVTTRIHDADTEATMIMTRARDEAGVERTRIVSDAELRAQALGRDADARAKEASAKMLRESEKEIARLAVLAAEKAMRAA
jgi:F-type H+-transporting ATPase subunit b